MQSIRQRIRHALRLLRRASPRPLSDVERRRLQSWASQGPGPLVVLQVRGGTTAWPDERWLQLGDRLQGALGAHLAFTGRRRDAAGLAPLAAALPGARSLAGRLDRRGLHELLQRAHLVVTGDPSFAAEARATRTPCLCLAQTGSGVRRPRRARRVDPARSPAVPGAQEVFRAAEDLLLPHLAHLEAARTSRS